MASCNSLPRAIQGLMVTWSQGLKPLLGSTQVFNKFENTCMRMENVIISYKVSCGRDYWIWHLNVIIALCLTKQNPSFSSYKIKDDSRHGTHETSNGIDNLVIRVTGYVLWWVATHFLESFWDTWKIGLVA